MVLGVFQRTIVDDTGDTLGGASVEVRSEATGALAVLFSDRAGTSGADNPFTAGPDGFAQFYLAQGSYRVVATSGGFSRTWRHEPVLALPDDGNFDASAFTALAAGASTARSLAEHLGDVANPRDFGAKGDLAERTDGTVTDASPVLSSAGATFEEADVGKDVTVEGAASVGVTITAVDKAPIDNAVQFDASTSRSIDLTADLNDADAGDVEPFPASEAVGDMFLIGHRAQFGSVTIDIGTPGVGGAVQWKYWDGSAWQNLTVTDNTSGFTAATGSHTVTFTPPVDWALRRFNEKDNQDLLYYIAAEVTTVYSTNPVLDQGTIDDGEIRVTTSVPHGFQAGQTISIKGVAGATEANGTFVIRHARSTNNIDRSRFDLIGSSFGSAYTSGGTAHGRLITTIASVSAGAATLNANAGASIAGTAKFRFGSDDTAAIQAAIDSGKSVIIPPGAYISGKLTVATLGQKVIGMGGRIVARSTTGAFTEQIEVTADEVSLEGLILENPDEQTQTSSPRVAGVIVTASKVRLAGLTVKGFQGGLNVSSSGEFFGSVIVGNRVLGVVGVSAEDRGDGIVSWAADTVIVGNYVTAKGWNEGVGMQGDARIGIHVEGLSPFHAEDSYRYEDTGATISGNVVRGKFRRGIVAENVAEATISGNVVAGPTWWAIAAIDNATGGGITIIGNTIFYDRPSQDQTELSADAAAIEIRSVNTDVRGIKVVGNAVRFSGTGRGIEMFGQSADIREVVIEANSFISRDLNDPGMSVALDIFQAIGVTIANNVMRGSSGDMVFGFSHGSLKMIGNTIKDCLGDTCINFSNAGGVADEYHIFEGNTIVWAGSGDGILVANRDNVIIEGNHIKNTSGNGSAIDLFGVNIAIVVGNILTMTSGTYIQNFVAGATKIDANNVKN